MEWHFANITDRWTKRALVANGFGFASQDEDSSINVTLNIAAVALEKGGAHVETTKGDEERGDVIGPVDSRSGSSQSAVATGPTLYGANWPFFHPDLRTATVSAVEGARRKNSAASF